MITDEKFAKLINVGLGKSRQCFKGFISAFYGSKQGQINLKYFIRPCSQMES